MPDYLLIPILLILSTFFSGMEIAFISANRLMIELDRKKGIGGSKVVSWLNSKLEAIVVTSLIGYIICLVIYGLRMAMVVEPMIGQIVIHPGWIQLIQILLATAIILITAELIPRTIFRMKANLMIRLFSYPFLIFFVLLSPLTYLTIGLSNFLRTKVLRKDGTSRTRQLLFGRADLHNLIDDTSSEHTGEEQPDQEVRLIQNVMEFPSIKLRECMVPRNEMLTIEVNESVEELKQEFIHSGHSRILVYEEDIDHIIGYIHHADLFRNPLNIREMIRPVPFVPETMPANKLLTRLLDNRQNIAVVIDEFGGTAGLVSGEDI
ncbi:MAG: CNNM domain-containing protein, partial [Bacteroidales bacterium]|nr:CNNM domain-containing protein [Bacteroidales bacterium]